MDDTRLTPIAPVRMDQAYSQSGPRASAQAFGFEVPLGNDPMSVRRRIEALEMVLERSATIPGTNYSIGLDTIVGLVPVVGDIITATMGAYLVWEARNLGIPKWKMWHMMGRVGFDAALGLVPIAGDALDLVYRSNTKNLKTIKKHLDKHHPETRILEQ